MPEAITSYEKQIEACCHTVAYRYWDFPAGILTNKVKERLDEEGEGQARDMIAQDYRQGELNCVVTVGDQDIEVHGWWTII